MKFLVTGATGFIGVPINITRQKLQILSQAAADLQKELETKE